MIRKLLFLAAAACCLLPFMDAGLALLPGLPLVLVSLLGIGLAVGALVSLQATIRQERAPTRLLPRVVGLSAATIPVVGPVGSILAGVLVDTVGLRPATELMALVAVTIGGAVLISPALRELDEGSPSSGVAPRPARPPESPRPTGLPLISLGP